MATLTATARRVALLCTAVAPCGLRSPPVWLLTPTPPGRPGPLVRGSPPAMIEGRGLSPLRRLPLLVILFEEKASP